MSRILVNLDNYSENLTLIGLLPGSIYFAADIFR